MFARCKSVVATATKKVIDALGKYRKATFAAITLFLIVLPLVLNEISYYYLHIVISIGIFYILALGLNVIVGYAGQFALGHAAFFGIGAYTSALLMVRLGASFWVGLVSAALFTAMAGFLLGLPVIRLRGDYLGIVTLAFGEIVRLLFVNLIPLTGGPMGIPGIPSPSLFGYTFSSRVGFYYLILALSAMTGFVVYRITHSGFGLNLLTIRKDESLASSMGIWPVKYKLSAFVIGAFFAGIAGAFWASYVSFISPDAFTYMHSVNILAMVVIGGSASIPGSLLGAVILVFIPELLRAASEYRMMLLGLAMVMMMIFRPTGFLGEKYRLFNFFGSEGVRLYGNNSQAGKHRG